MAGRISRLNCILPLISISNMSTCMHAHKNMRIPVHALASICTYAHAHTHTYADILTEKMRIYCIHNCTCYKYIHVRMQLSAANLLAKKVDQIFYWPVCYMKKLSLLSTKEIYKLPLIQNEIK